jgi:hypothetical protein
MLIFLVNDVKITTSKQDRKQHREKISFVLLFPIATRDIIPFL